MRTPLSSQYARCFSSDFLSHLDRIELAIGTTKKSIIDIKKIITCITPPQFSEYKKHLLRDPCTINQNSQRKNELFCTTRVLSYKYQCLTIKNRELCQERADLFTKHFSPRA